MMRQAMVFLVLAASMAGACAHTQSPPASNCEASSEPPRANSAEDDEFGIKKAGDGVECEERLDAQTCADLRALHR
jgi:hypothetical protein